MFLLPFVWIRRMVACGMVPRLFWRRSRLIAIDPKSAMAAYSSSGKQQTSLLLGVMLPILGLFASLATSLWAGNLDSARQLYQRTAYEAALRALGAEGSQDAMVLLLAGQIYYQLGKYQEASEQLEKASELQPGSAEIFLWLGRSLGRRAEASSFFTAPGYARRCREALEQAVALNGRYLEAMSDLAIYYLEAPGFLGGGLEKAAKLASRLASLDAAAGHSVQARIAEKRQDFSGAEAHLEQAAEMAPRQIDRLIDLAKFFARRGKVQQSEQALATAAEVAPESPKLLFTRAEIYIQRQRNLKEAQMLLRRYLQMPLTPEDPPRRDAERLLAQSGS
jgi:tetratricopeptide (TPR) repeat protein